MKPARVTTWAAVLALLVLLAPACAGPEKYTDVSKLQELPADHYVYTLAPGDEVAIEVLQDKDYNHETTVLPDGSASFRWIGEIQVAGLTLAQTRESLRAKLAPYYNAPTLSLKLKRINGPDPIVFLGNFGGSASGGPTPQVSRGGVIPYRKGMGVMEAVARAGGVGEPDIDVAPYLFVVRNIKSVKDRTVYRFDLAEAVRGGSPDLPLHPGDVMFIDQSWLQDLSRALGYVSQVVGSTTQGIGTALLIDTISDRARN
ncbi:MAG: polysaccharide biosynthesis/export family protein [Planctomycetes bacterium]|jgi:polysaccharide export outer membrane protein|nr:polysaccharide biosynthesis/export family protein [Planctomycetota bacterium]MCL4731040.1 polysaccharide biosynthesis/export family protein [Planctomycetota bacterium]